MNELEDFRPGGVVGDAELLEDLIAHTGCLQQNPQEKRLAADVAVAHADGLFLRAPQEREIEPAGETYHGEVRRLATFRNRLDDPGRQKPEREQPPTIHERP